MILERGAEVPEGGFTLLEVMVALVIAALALAVFYEGSLSGLRNARVAGTYEEAISLARSHLAELSQRQTVQPLDAEGADGPLFHYRVKVALLASEQLQRSLLEEANNRPPRTAGLYSLSVTESWTQDGRERQVHLLGESMIAMPAAQQ
jgi:prepilin-type N-terminal cleavage/methylation domain-containing protein